MNLSRSSSVAALSLFLALAACGGASTASVPPSFDLPIAPGPHARAKRSHMRQPTPKASAPKDRFAEIVAEADRLADDRALDRGRHPAELLSFAGVNEGMRVAEVGAWKGYTADLLARAVGDAGRVYAVDPAKFDKFTSEAWAARAKNAKVMARITRVARDYEDPLPPDANGLDAVFVIMFYHDMVWLKTDRAKMNRAIFAALKSGGEYVIVDHHAKTGDGVKDVETMHRIEESVVRAEVEQAGFKLAAVGDFMRNPNDTRDWNDSDEAPMEKRGTSDRFVLRYVKP
jgi:predicted methyltransferase